MSGYSFIDSGCGLFTDLYELTMAQAYLAEGMDQPATFSLFFRHLPENRNYIVSCGSEAVAEVLERVRFSREDIEYLRGQRLFSEGFLDYLSHFRFSGELHALTDGTP